LLLDEIAADTSVVIPSMVVASWTEVSCNSSFFLLSNAQPSSRLHQMIPRGRKFLPELAAEGLIQM
jgi:hypothetical protein